MEKLILVFGGIAISAGAYAQADSTNRNLNLQDRNNKQEQKIKTGISLPIAPRKKTKINNSHFKENSK